MIAALSSPAFTTRLPTRKATPHIHLRPRSSSARTTAAIRNPEDAEKTQGPSQMALRLIGAVAAAQLAILPIAGLAVADANLSGGSATGGLSTSTKPEGLGAKIEASDITKESTDDVLAKLKKVVPEAKEMIARQAQGTGSSYPSSIAKELETVESEVEAQIQAASNGQGDPSNLKSFLSGVEQQVNALKAIAGFD